MYSSWWKETRNGEVTEIFYLCEVCFDPVGVMKGVVVVSD